MTGHRQQRSTYFCSKALRRACRVQTNPGDVKLLHSTIRIGFQIDTPVCDAMLLAIKFS